MLALLGRGLGVSDEKALVTLEDEAAMTERARLKKERKDLRRAAHQAELDSLVARIKADAAKITNLRRYMFKDDEELVAAGLTAQQRRIVRQFEEPKKSTAFGVESAAKLVEVDARGKAEAKRVELNVENMTIQLPEKRRDEVEPVIIEVDVK